MCWSRSRSRRRGSSTCTAARPVAPLARCTRTGTAGIAGRRRVRSASTVSEGGRSGATSGAASPGSPRSASANGTSAATAATSGSSRSRVFTSTTGVNSRCRLLEAAQHVDRRVLVAAGAARGRARAPRSGCRPCGRRCVRGSRAPRPGRAVRRRTCGCRSRTRGGDGRRCGRGGARPARRSGADRGSRRRCAPSPSCPRGGRRRRPSSRTRASRNSPWIGLSSRSISSMKSGMRWRSPRSSAWSSGSSARRCIAEPEESRGRLAARREQVRGDERDVVHVGDRPVGEGRGGDAGHHVVARFAPELLDVRGEPVVEELQRLVRHRAAAGLPGRAVVALQLLRGTSRGRLRERRADRRSPRA